MEYLTHINVKTKEAFIIDSDGSVIDKGKFIPEKDIISQQKQQNAYRNKMNNSFSLSEGGAEHHIGCFQKQIKELVPLLSLTDCGFLITLLAKVQMNSNGLLIHNNKPMTVTDIQKYLKKSRSQTSIQLKKLTNIGLITEIKDGSKKYYQINSVFHIVGKHQKQHKNLWFIRLYKGKLKEMIDDLSLREIGFIYKCLPICHFNMFYLVHNPNDPYNVAETALDSDEYYCENRLEFFNRKELAAYMNENMNNITEIVKSLQEKGLIMKSSTSRTVSYRLHPHVVHPKGTVPNLRIKYICDEFEAHKQALLYRQNKGNVQEKSYI